MSYDDLTGGSMFRDNTFGRNTSRYNYNTSGGSTSCGDMSRGSTSRGDTSGQGTARRESFHHYSFSGKVTSHQQFSLDCFKSESQRSMISMTIYHLELLPSDLQHSLFESRSLHRSVAAQFYL